MQDEDVLNVPHMDYFKQLDTLLSEIPPNDLEHYLTFREFINLVPATTTQMRSLFHQWNAINGASAIPSPRYFYKILKVLCRNNIVYLFIIPKKILLRMLILLLIMKLACRWKVCTHATKAKFSAKVSQMLSLIHI